jgi:hypothetical protein
MIKNICWSSRKVVVILVVVKYNGTMPRKAEGGGFCGAEVLRNDAVMLGAQFPMFLPTVAKHHPVTEQYHTPADLNTGSPQFVTTYFASIHNNNGFVNRKPKIKNNKN